jgi:hypothetical protein
MDINMPITNGIVATRLLESSMNGPNAGATLRAPASVRSAC